MNIKPTVGRIVWYMPNGSPDIIVTNGSEPLPAIITVVWSNTCVNLCVFDANGRPQPRCSVTLVHDVETGAPYSGAYCHWMPYQKAMAAKEAADVASGVGSVSVVEHNAVEAMIQAKGLTAPRVTPQDIEANIVSEHYFTAMDGAAEAAGDARSHHNRVKDDADVADVHRALSLLTFCVLVLSNDFTVTGESACASPENFDAELGRKIARQNAVNKIWPLMGYALRQRLHEGIEG